MSLVVLYLVSNCYFVFIANDILFIDDLAFFSLRSYVLWSVIEVSEPSGCQENENNRCSVTCPGFQPLEFRFVSFTCIGMWDLKLTDYLTSFFIGATPLHCSDAFSLSTFPPSNFYLSKSSIYFPLLLFNPASNSLPSGSSPNPALVN